MDIQTRKQKLKDWIDGADEASLREVENVVNPEADWWDETPQEVKDAIARGDQEFLEGKTMSTAQINAKLNPRYQI